jgi:hypothetical protein
MPPSEELAEGSTIKPRSRRERLSVRVTEDVDEDTLTATAEKWALLGGGAPRRRMSGVLVGELAKRVVFVLLLVWWGDQSVF